jgi:type IV secretion system protein VirB10
VTNPYTLIQGKVIPAVLGRDLNTDLPGAATACTTLDVYDSISSNYLLIPKGSCLIGKYSNAIRSGQERVMFAFSRIVLPNGLSFDLPGNTGSDLGGAAGVAGDVNNHFFHMFTSSLLVAVLADKAEVNKPPPTTNTGSGGANSAAGQVLVEVSRSILDRNKVIPPTITVTKGTRINVEVTKDMEFPGPYRNR